MWEYLLLSTALNFEVGLPKAMSVPSKFRAKLRFFVLFPQLPTWRRVRLCCSCYLPFIASMRRIFMCGIYFFPFSSPKICIYQKIVVPLHPISNKHSLSLGASRENAKDDPLHSPLGPKTGPNRGLLGGVTYSS